MNVDVPTHHAFFRCDSVFRKSQPSFDNIEITQNKHYKRRKHFEITKVNLESSKTMTETYDL